MATKSSMLLLPQSPQTLMRDVKTRLMVLKLKAFLVKQAIQAIEAFFFNGQLSCFDPHVGETLCQIRAFAFAEMFKNKERYFSHADVLKQYAEIKAVLARIEEAFVFFSNFHGGENSNLKTKVSKKESLLEFFDKNQLNFHISENIFCLIVSYILAKFNTLNLQDDVVINYDAFCQEMVASKTMARNIVRIYQQELAQYSSQYILKALDCQQEVCGDVQWLQQLKKTDEDGREVLPCYLVAKALLFQAKQNRLPLVVIIERASLFSAQKNKNMVMVFTVRQGKYQLAGDHLGAVGDYPCVVIKGICASIMATKRSLTEQFEHYGLENILLANMAAHPQYSGKKLMDFKYNPYASHAKKYPSILEQEYLGMINLAERIGCTKGYPDLFFIKHIFCDTVKNYINQSASQSLDLASCLPLNGQLVV